MFVVIICSLIAILFTFLESRGTFPNGMKLGFVLVTILGVIHYDFGNDYMSYYSVYESIKDVPFDFELIMSGDLYREPGWVFLNYLFKPVGGFFMLVAVLSIIQNVIIYNFIKNEVSVKWYPLAVFVYLYTTSYFLLSFTMLRQWFVACVFLWSWSLIKQRKWIVSLVILYLCSLVHSSAIILLPFAFWGFLPLRKSKVYAVLFVVLIIALWFSGGWVESLLEKTMTITETESYYERYDVERNTFTFGLGVILQFIPLFVGEFFLYNAENYPKEQKLLVAISLLGFAITPLNQVMPMIGRLGIYFGIFSIASLSITYAYIKKPIIRWGFLGLFLFITGYN